MAVKAILCMELVLLSSFASAVASYIPQQETFNHSSNAESTHILRHFLLPSNEGFTVEDVVTVAQVRLISAIHDTVTNPVFRRMT